MLPPLPRLEDYHVSPVNGFLPSRSPLTALPDPYYREWEAIVSNLQALILSKRLRGVVNRLPVLKTTWLHGEREWRRAYQLLSFIAHGYIWGGDLPSDRLPPAISIPYLEVSAHLELPPVATYAACCLWNHKSLFQDEPIDNLDNLSTLHTFTGSLDESWFYLVSVAIEARGAPIIPLMLQAIEAARQGEAAVVRDCLTLFAERLDDVTALLGRMYESCDPHVFYHRIRPFLAGSKNMAEAGLPNGVWYDVGDGKVEYRQYSGGSNAQSSLIQFFDIVLGVEHRPTGEKPLSAGGDEQQEMPSHSAPKHNFIQEMRTYMPGPHKRFLEHVQSVSNIREFVASRPEDRTLSLAYDACLAMLRALRDKHIQIVSRYIIIKSRESRSHSRSTSPRKAPPLATSSPQVVNIASTLHSSTHGVKKPLRGTGGTALLSFLKQARDETAESAMAQGWLRRLGRGDRWDDRVKSVGQEFEVVGLAGTWTMEDGGEGGLCHW